jgi:hypothetical protein
MTPDEQLDAMHQLLRAFVTDHQELASRPQGILGILQDLETVEAFLTWCVRKGHLAEIPVEAARIAIDHLRWSQQEDAILRQWAAERPEMAHAVHVPGSPEALEQAIACLRWRIDRGFSEAKGGAKVLQHLEDVLSKRREEAKG